MNKLFCSLCGNFYEEITNDEGHGSTHLKDLGMTIIAGNMICSKCWLNAKSLREYK